VQSARLEEEPGMDDRELLTEYAASGSERAFGEVVTRYADMVYATCMRVLGSAHAAEDAAQATFMVFATKGRRLKPGTILSGWLHLTARQAALGMRQQERRRARRERESAEMCERTRGEGSWTEVSPQLDAALAALPRVQREALVLRYLCGKSGDDVAREVGVSKAAVAKRLTRALARLRERLAAGGAVVPVAALGGLLSSGTSLGAPEGLAAMLQSVCLGKAVASPVATSVAKGVIKMMFWTKVKMIAGVVSIVTVLGGAGGILAVKLAAGEPKAAPKVASKSPDMVPLNSKWPKIKWPTRNPVPYANDPAVVAKLKALGEGSGLKLGKFKTTPADVTKWHRTFKYGPSRRGFCNKMPYAPDRKTAMYCGGDHGVPHGLNDVWEFHLGSNTWSLICPPSSNKHVLRMARGRMSRAKKAIAAGKDVAKNKVVAKKAEAAIKQWWSEKSVKEGYFQSRNGGPVHPWHTWDGLTYDTRTRRLYWAELSSHNVKRKVQHVKVRNYAKMTGQDADKLAAKIKPGTPMYAYDPAEGRWMRQMGSGPFPNMRGMGGMLHYIPDIDKTFWLCNSGNTVGSYDGMWVYDAKTNKWSCLITGGALMGLARRGAAPYGELQAAYSSRHKKLVAVLERGTFVYDIKTNKWTKAARSTGYAHDAQSVFVYDSNADVFMLIAKDGDKYWSGDVPWRLGVYDLSTDKWAVVKIKGENVPGKKASYAGYYDPEHNVLAVYVMTRSGGFTWVYRHRKTKK
jgi:RNA polymerase sigma factor (sigma-70 family)